MGTDSNNFSDQIEAAVFKIRTGFIQLIKLLTYGLLCGTLVGAVTGYFGGLLDDGRLRRERLSVGPRRAGQLQAQGERAVPGLRGVGLSDDASLLDQVRVDVHLSDVIDDNGELDAFPVGKDAVQKGRFAASEIAGEEQDRHLFLFHIKVHGQCAVFVLQKYAIRPDSG